MQLNEKNIKIEETIFEVCSKTKVKSFKILSKLCLQNNKIYIKMYLQYESTTSKTSGLKY